MITINYWVFAAILLALGGAAYGLGHWSAALKAERLRFAQLMILRQLSQDGDVDVCVSGKERQDE